MALSTRWIAPVMLAAGVTAVAGILGMRSAPPPPAPEPPRFQPMVESSPLGPAEDLVLPATSETLRNGDSLSVAANRVGLTSLEVDELVRSFAGVFDFRAARPGHRFDFLRDTDGRLAWFRFRAGPRSSYHAFRAKDGAFTTLAEEASVFGSTSFVSGEIQDSLYLAMEAAGESPALTMLMVDLFAWDIDFYTETQKGDRFRLIVEKEYIEGRFAGYGRVIGAEYTMSSGRTARAFFYQPKDGKPGYYTPEGTSVKKAFLKSPIQFASITSRYGMRRHPVLGYQKKHQGIDFGAPRGTAVWAVADGVATHVGPKGGYGNVVIVRHANGLETRYAHLSAFGKGVHAGRHVEQKQVIGYVGATGLATGPHLHFEVLDGGRFMNPAKVAAPPTPPILSEEMPAFREAIAPVIAAIEAGRTTLALAPKGE